MSLSSWGNWLSAFVITCRSCQSCLFVNRTTTQTTQLKVLHWVLVRRILSKPIVLKTNNKCTHLQVWNSKVVYGVTQWQWRSFSSVQSISVSWSPGSQATLAFWPPLTGSYAGWTEWMDANSIRSDFTIKVFTSRLDFWYASGFYCCQSPSENGCFNCVLWNLMVRRMKSGIHPQHEVKSNDKSQNAGWWLAKSCVIQWLGNGLEEMRHFQFVRSQIPRIEGRSCDRCLTAQGCQKDSTTGKTPCDCGEKWY